MLRFIPLQDYHNRFVVTFYFRPVTFTLFREEAESVAREEPFKSFFVDTAIEIRKLLQDQNFVLYIHCVFF